MTIGSACRWSHEVFALAGLVAFAAACVPRGDPPAGRQLVTDRNGTLAGVIRPTGDGTTRVLVARPVEDSPAGAPPPRVDLYVASVDSATAPPVERLLASDVAGFYVDCRVGLTDCFRSDARGRLLITTGYDASGFPVMARVDPVTGERLELGATPSFYLSPSGARLVAFSAARDPQATLYDADDRVVPLGQTTSGLFVGENWYYATVHQELLRVAPGGDPETLATGVTGFTAQPTDAGVLVTLTRPTPDPLIYTYSILDAATLEETPSPLGARPFTLSPDGQWLLAIDFSAGRGTFVERSTGARQVFDFPPFQVGNYEWRPGRTEVWLPDGQYPNPSIWIESPGVPGIQIPALVYGYTNAFGQGSFFTPDGGSWFSSRGIVGDRPVIQVAPADSPTGPRFDLAPAGTSSFQYWQLSDGRILAPAWVTEPKRNDLYAVDPTNGSSSVLGEAGYVMAVGQQRVLANLHVNDSRGDLAVIDLATGRATVLAPEFTLSAFAEPHGDDRAPVGAPLAYQFRARFDSPYDGIWLATVP